MAKKTSNSRGKQPKKYYNSVKPYQTLNEAINDKALEKTKI